MFGGSIIDYSLDDSLDAFATGIKFNQLRDPTIADPAVVQMYKEMIDQKVFEMRRDQLPPGPKGRPTADDQLLLVHRHRLRGRLGGG